MTETWKDVPGYDGWYQASDQGRVRSWHGRGNNQAYRAPRRREPRILGETWTHLPMPGDGE